MSLKNSTPPLRPDLLLVAPPLIWGQENRLDIKPPLNLIFLASYLNAKGFHTTILDVIAEQVSFEQVLGRIKDQKPRYIGLPFYQGTKHTALELCREIKKRFPSLMIIAGGPLVTTYPEGVIAFPEIDIGVIGEGEITMEKLLSSPPQTWPSISGVVYRKDGRVLFSEPASPIENLDSLPLLDFSLVRMETYYSFQKSLHMPKWLFLTTSRGCPFRCVFCATPVLWPGKIRRNSIPRILQEIAHQKKLVPDINIGFMDDSFFSDKTWLHQFFEEIPKAGVRYCCIGRADHLEQTDIERLAQTGCHYVGIGVETGNSARQKKIKKYLNLDKVKEAVKHLSYFHILCKCFFMLGFPDETPEEMLETINFAVELKHLGMSECNFFPVSIYPGTELAQAFDERAFASRVYEPFDQQNRAISDLKAGEDAGEKRLSIYASVPDADINLFFSGTGLLGLVKFAYNCVESGTSATLDQVRQFTLPEKTGPFSEKGKGAGE